MRRHGLQFMTALIVKKFVDDAMHVQIVGQPAPELKDLEYFQVPLQCPVQRDFHCNARVPLLQHGLLHNVFHAFH